MQSIIDLRTIACFLYFKEHEFLQLVAYTHLLNYFVYFASGDSENSKISFIKDVDGTATRIFTFLLYAFH